MMDTLEEAISRYNAKLGVNVRIKAILSDMDGVLYDSMRRHTSAWAETMRGEGFECREEEFYLHEGRTGKATINIYFDKYLGRDATEEEVQRIYREKARRFTAFGNADPIKGAPETFEMIKRAGIKTILVTGSGQRSLLSKIDSDFKGIFSPQTMVTAFDVVHGKPDPEPYLIGLAKADVSKEEAIVLENAPLGVQSGKAAGIFTVAINTGPLPNKILYDAGADIVFDNMISFSKAIKNLIC